MITASLSFLPPPFAWIEVPGKLGTKWNDKPFYISKYPLTNDQFEVFIKDLGGYKDIKWWDFSEDAKRYRQSHQLRSTGFGGSNHPRTNLAIYDAVAYCQWLSYKTGENIRLPTIKEWLYAAQGDERRAYPWGNEFDKNRCNSKLPITPVNQYEGKGNSPFGVVDMCGNVWEWCTSDKYIDSLSSGFVLGGSRGGESDIIPDSTSPNNASPSVGFRLLRS